MLRTPHREQKRFCTHAAETGSACHLWEAWAQTVREQALRTEFRFGSTAYEGIPPDCCFRSFPMCYLAQDSNHLNMFLRQCPSNFIKAPGGCAQSVISQCFSGQQQQYSVSGSPRIAPSKNSRCEEVTSLFSSYYMYTHNRLLKINLGGKWHW